MSNKIPETINDNSTVDNMENIYLNFCVDNQTYGIAVKYVLGIVRMQEYMQNIVGMPEMQPGMKGFINLYDDMVPLVSTRFQLGKTEEAYTDHTCIITVQVGQKKIGLIVDAIQKTVTIKPENILPLPDVCKGTENCIIGVARIDDGCVTMLIHVKNLLLGRASRVLCKRQNKRNIANNRICHYISGNVKVKTKMNANAVLTFTLPEKDG